MRQIMNKMKISKSDYVLGIKCEHALWLKKHRHELMDAPKNEMILKQGTEVGLRAQEYFKNGTKIDEELWTAEGLEAALLETKKAMNSIVFREYYENARGDEQIDSNDESDAIYEATAMTGNREYCAVDILENNHDGTWNLIEVKSTTTLKDKGIGPNGGVQQDQHLVDASFQRYVLETAGIKIKKCFIMILNKEYVKKGELDIKQLFKKEDVTDKLHDMQHVKRELDRLHAFLAQPEIRRAITKRHCKNMYYDCPFMGHCWKNIPKFSVFNAFTTNSRPENCDQLYERYETADMNVITETPSAGLKKIATECFREDLDNSDTEKLREFIDGLEYPLYFLDYEAMAPAIPILDGTHPYKTVCFQFSLHIVDSPDAAPRHRGYLHDKPGTDPRPELINKLIDYCGEKGSILTYTSYEKTQTTKMAEDFPDRADELRAIIARFVDLAAPFQKGYIYSRKQNGFYSVKKTLPAFTDMSYADLNITDGMKAASLYTDFANGNMTPDEAQTMRTDLWDYCERDTIAMVDLLNVIKKNC